MYYTQDLKSMFTCTYDILVNNIISGYVTFNQSDALKSVLYIVYCTLKCALCHLKRYCIIRVHHIKTLNAS